MALPNEPPVGRPQELDDVTSAVSTLLLFLAVGTGMLFIYASRAHGGLAVKCYNLLDRTGTSPCGRIRVGAAINLVVQVPIVTSTCYLVIKRRVGMSRLIFGLCLSLLGAGLCFVYMRSWEFGLK
jgi:hypothetical protein